MTDTSVMQDRIGQLCGQFKLPTMGAQSVARFTAAGHGDALATFLEVLEQEAEDRPPPAHQPAAPGVPAALWQDLGNLRARPSPPGAAAATGPAGPGQLCGARRQRPGLRTAWHRQDPRPLRLGHRLVEAGHSVLFAPAYRLVQELLAAKRDLDLPRQLRKLDNFDFLLLGALGQVAQGAEESEVLFTLIAERYERRSLGITSNLVFSEWERIFANPMATAAAIDRVVHHSVILEFDVPSYRTNAAQQRGQAKKVNRQN